MAAEAALHAFLHEHNLAPIAAHLRDITLASVCDTLEREGRANLLAALRAKGLTLPERQSFANALMRVQRQRRLEALDANRFQPSAHPPVQPQCPRCALLLASQSYPYNCGLGPAQQTTWHNSESLASIARFVYRRLTSMGCTVEVFAACEDGLDTLCDELRALGVVVVGTTSAHATNFIDRVVAACNELPIAHGSFDHIIVTRPDLLFREDIPAPAQWSPSAISCRARNLSGPDAPTDPDLLSWWDGSQYTPAERADFTPDDQLLLVPKACLEIFARVASQEELHELAQRGFGELRGCEQRLRCIWLERRALPFSCVAMPCVLMKHAEHKAAFGRRDAPTPALVWRSHDLSG